MISLSDILTASDMKAETVDALRQNLLPLLKKESQEDVKYLLSFAKWLVEARERGDDVAAERTKRHIALLLENNKIQWIDGIIESGGDIALSIVNAFAMGAVKATLGGGAS